MKFVKRDAIEEGCQNIIALTGHPVNFVPLYDKEQVKEMSEVPLIDLPVYNNIPRVQYKYQSSPNWEQSFILEVHPTGIENLPKPIKGLKYVVSRETLRVITQQNELIARRDKLNNMIQEAKELLAIVEEQEFSKAKTLAENLLHELEEELQRVNEKIFLHKPRTDFLAPGRQLKKSTKNGQKTLASCGLISALH